MLAWCTPASLTGQSDDSQVLQPRDRIDVLAYRLDLEILTESQEISGVVVMEARVVAEFVDELALDLAPTLRVKEIHMVQDPIFEDSRIEGASVRFEHTGNRLRCFLPAAHPQGALLRIAVHYAGRPRFRWDRTPSGKPWVASAGMTQGAHTWWPCKASYFDPGDKAERIWMNLTVPAGLFAVSNGRLERRSSPGFRKETFHWQHFYPIQTYAVSLNIGPYKELRRGAEPEGLDRTLPIYFYVLRENEEKAKLLFDEVEQLLRVYSEIFGPYPFAESKFSLVDAPYLSSEQSTALTYANTYPAWCRENNVRDRRAAYNRFFDADLVHEIAREWWGGAVSATSWGERWIHDGFTTYGAVVFLEKTRGRAVAEQYLSSLRKELRGRTGLVRNQPLNSRQSFSTTLGARGAWVLHTCRQFMKNDDLWWKCLREFYGRYRMGHAGAAEFGKVLEEVTGEPWKRFVDQWVLGNGYPQLSGFVLGHPDRLEIAIENQGSGATQFHVPLDLVWNEGGVRREERIWIRPGGNRLDIPTRAFPQLVSLDALNQILLSHQIQVQ